MNIAVIGLGKIGACLAAVYSSRGHRVAGVELNQQIIENLNGKRSPFLEPLLQDLLLKSYTLEVSDDLDLAVDKSDFSVIMLPTPSNPDGSFSNDFILPVLQKIKVLKGPNKPHTVIISSTVSPGTFSNILEPILREPFEDGSLSQINVVYSPVFVALGNVITDIVKPEVVLIGTSSKRLGEEVIDFFSSFIESKPAYCIVSPTSAELAKLAVNTFVTTKISFANMIGELCDSLPDANSEDVLNAVGSDSRIGKKYLRAALGYGGPCFPRDNKALFSTAKSLGVSAPLAEATDEINRRQASRLVNKVRDLMPATSRIGVLGLSYKAETPVCDASQGIQIANSLKDYGYDVHVHDPEGLKEAKGSLLQGISVKDDVKSVIETVELIVIATPWPQYEKLSALIPPNLMVIDPWQVLKSDK